jgi:hypothetical protein
MPTPNSQKRKCQTITLTVKQTINEMSKARSRSADLLTHFDNDQLFPMHSVANFFIILGTIPIYYRGVYIDLRYLMICGGRFWWRREEIRISNLFTVSLESEANQVLPLKKGSSTGVANEFFVAGIKSPDLLIWIAASACTKKLKFCLKRHFLCNCDAEQMPYKWTNAAVLE